MKLIKNVFEHSVKISAKADDDTVLTSIKKLPSLENLEF
jgi:hypothetical protein